MQILSRQYFANNKDAHQINRGTIRKHFYFSFKISLYIPQLQCTVQRLNSTTDLAYEAGKRDKFMTRKKLQYQSTQSSQKGLKTNSFAWIMKIL